MQAKHAEAIEQALHSGCIIAIRHPQTTKKAKRGQKKGGISKEGYDQLARTVDQLRLHLGGKEGGLTKGNPGLVIYSNKKKRLVETQEFLKTELLFEAEIADFDMLSNSTALWKGLWKELDSRRSPLSIARGLVRLGAMPTLIKVRKNLPNRDCSILDALETAGKRRSVMEKAIERFQRICTTEISHILTRYEERHKTFPPVTIIVGSEIGIGAILHGLVKTAMAWQEEELQTIEGYCFGFGHAMIAWIDQTDWTLRLKLVTP